ncbi:MAG: hypothetical protein HMLKMBBP_01301 [Planctomycetes bacterium]|nr:hypothetical protein [Planctomycetota bacterium]
MPRTNAARSVSAATYAARPASPTDEPPAPAPAAPHPLDLRMVVRTVAPGMRAAFALKPFRKGAILSPFGARRTDPAPSRYTIQTAPGRHIHLDPQPLECINHGCDPNVAFDVERMRVVVVRAIRAGEEFRAFYPSTEWAMDEPFDCACGSPKCLRRITGARDLGAAAMSGRPFVAPHVSAPLRTH